MNSKRSDRGHPIEPGADRGVLVSMKHEHSLEWPGWATFALIAVFATAVITIAAAINDIW